MRRLHFCLSVNVGLNTVLKTPEYLSQQGRQEGTGQTVNIGSVLFPVEKVVEKSMTAKVSDIMYKKHIISTICNHECNGQLCQL